MGTPLRGELTRVAAVPSSSQSGGPQLDEKLSQIQHILSQFMRLTRPQSNVPSITFTSETADVDSSLSASASATAPWTWTAAEAASTEAVLHPFLMHLAASRDDIETLSFCMGTTDGDGTVTPATETLKHGLMAGGIVNALEPGSGRSPLHVAALNGHIRSVNLLLQSGALVHLRDTMGHTPLYYVSECFVSVALC